MKRLAAVSAIALICLSAIAVAAPDPQKTDTTLTGTVASIDASQKVMVVKDSAGKDVTVYFTDSTSVNGGELREGSAVTVSVTQKDGKTWANSIQVGKKSY